MNLGFDEGKITDGCDVVDNDHFYPARKKRNASGCRILTISRWSPEKNLVAAAKAFLDFLRGRPESEAWTWKLAGYGPLESELRECARRSAGRIQLLGAKDYSELPLTFADADLYWQPSLREPWALVVNEAMASGLPLLVSNRCGCHENLVTAETGWTFDPTSHDGMVQALQTAAASHRQWPEMGASSARLIEQWGLQRFSDGLNQAVRIATQT
jgi:glycosyltransferase involved in cell wall biosynthesis